MGPQDRALLPGAPQESTYHMTRFGTVLSCSASDYRLGENKVRDFQFRGF